MNCCDEYGECRQGRDCPIRTGQAKVARIGRRDYTREALPPSAWRVYLRYLAKWMLFCVVVLLASAGVVLLASAAVVGVLHA